MVPEGMRGNDNQQKGSAAPYATCRCAWDWGRHSAPWIRYPRLAMGNTSRPGHAARTARTA
jgi:hypothetical protein